MYIILFGCDFSLNENPKLLWGQQVGHVALPSLITCTCTSSLYTDRI